MLNFSDRADTDELTPYSVYIWVRVGSDILGTWFSCPPWQPYSSLGSVSFCRTCSAVCYLVDSRIVSWQLYHWDPKHHNHPRCRFSCLLCDDQHFWNCLQWSIHPLSFPATLVGESMQKCRTEYRLFRLQVWTWKMVAGYYLQQQQLGNLSFSVSLFGALLYEWRNERNKSICQATSCVALCPETSITSFSVVNIYSDVLFNNPGILKVTKFPGWLLKK